MRAKVLCVAGTRPNFMKVAPLLRALRARPLSFDARLVHSGQHYDDRLSKIFFDDLAIPRPDVELEVGSGSHAQQTAEIMRRFEPVMNAEQPRVVVVVGDVNSTIACALVAAKHFLPEPFPYRGVPRRRPLVVHVEAGLRSFDGDMPEEVNRKLTDAISDLLYVSDPAGIENLRSEGVPEECVKFVGNVMIDTLLAARSRAMDSSALARLAVGEKTFALVTLHRPSNVDDPEALGRLLRTLDEVARRTGLTMVFPVHPRTQQRLEAGGLLPGAPHWRLCDPLGYLDFVRLESSARIVLTDSGGVQEETTVLGVPCVTLRQNTERPCTIREGTNVLGGTEHGPILAAVERAMTMIVEGRVPPYWDGRSAERIAEHLAGVLST